MGSLTKDETTTTTLCILCKRHFLNQILIKHMHNSVREHKNMMCKTAEDIGENLKF